MIRPMTAQDIPVLIGMGAAMHMESRYAKLDFDPEKLRGLGETILGDPDSWLALVAERDSEIIGFCIGYVAPHFFGNDLTSGDLAIYVSPDHRGGMTGARLVKAYDAWCSEQGVSEPLLGVSAGITPDRIGQLYERLGYTAKFTIYKKPNNHL
jgi:GNAT superfamily N-acetyltransferase|tara:strand:- start:3245 stop:3703 length:459 start_codon:yes stop_codon:yes gene_type:complete